MTTGRDSRLCRAGEDLAREARLLCVIPFHFMGARALLARQGLIPSFVRVECNFSDADVYATDWLAQGQIAGKPEAEAETEAAG